MTSLYRGSQSTLHADSSSTKTPRQSFHTQHTYTGGQSTTSFTFDENGHPDFDELDRVGDKGRGPRPFSMDTIGNNEPHVKPRRSALRSQGSSDESLRTLPNGRGVEFSNLPREPEKSYHPRKRGRQPSSLWIRDSEGRPIIEIGLNEGKYTASPQPEGDGAGYDSHDDREGEKSQDTEKGKGGPPQPVGFWDKSLKKTRLNVIKRWAIMTAILSTFILAILSLYWAVLFKIDDNLNSIIVFVVNFETQSDALVGPMVTKMTESIVEENKIPHLGFITIPPSAYDNDPVAVRQAIYEEEAFAAIVVNPNATTALRSAVETGNSSYDPTGAIQLVYVEARDQDTYYNYIYPNIQTLQTQITMQFGLMWTQQVLANDSIPRANLEKAPQALSPGIGFATFQLRPFMPYTAVPAVSIGLIYLIIISFFSFSFFLPIHMSYMGPGHPPLKFNQLIVWRWCATICAYLILSLAYSLVSLAFQVPFGQPTGSETMTSTDPNAFGNGTFPVYWMINFVGMIALGMACENVAMIVGMPWTALWLIFWVITNVATSFYALETSPAFFRWGYAWPLHNIVEASRTVLFDLHSRLGLNFGVLFAWAAVNTTLFPFCCYFMRWKTMREKKKQGKGQ